MNDQCVVQPNVYVIVVIVGVVINNNLVSYSYQKVYDQFTGQFPKC